MRRVSRYQREALSYWRGEMAGYLAGDLTAAARDQLRYLMERAMETEIGQRLGAERYVRAASRRDWRNGCRRRDLVTELGLLRGLRVPRARGGGYQPGVFQRYQRRQPLVNALIVAMYVAGVATCRVGEILEALLGDCPSASTVSRVARELDARARAFHQRRLQDRWQFLLLDGVRMKVKGAAGLRTRLVLVAYGMDGAGNRELLDFRLSSDESEAEWSALLESLRSRGLEGNALRLVITDGAPGLLAAIRLVFPYAAHQRCWVHKLRNVVNSVRKADQPQVTAGVQQIYLAATRREAIAAFRRWKQRWRQPYPKAVACLERDLEELLACFDYPAWLRPKIPHHQRHRARLPGGATAYPSHDCLHQRCQLRTDHLCLVRTPKRPVGPHPTAPFHTQVLTLPRAGVCAVVSSTTAKSEEPRAPAVCGMVGHR